MQCATWIEARSARRTCRRTIQVLTDGQLSAARAAQHRLLIELSLRPNPGGMIGFQFVTVEAGIVGPAAVEFYRDDIELAAIVRAARARIYLDPSYRNSRNRELHVTLPQISAAASLGFHHARFQRTVHDHPARHPLESVATWCIVPRREAVGGAGDVTKASQMDRRARKPLRDCPLESRAKRSASR